MKKVFILIAIIINVTINVMANDISQAQALAERLSPRLAQKVLFQKLCTPYAPHLMDFFTLESKGDKVVIGGNNALSMAVGLNRYLNRYCKSTVSWYGDIAVELPSTLPDVPEKERAAEK